MLTLETEAPAQGAHLANLTAGRDPREVALLEALLALDAARDAVAELVRLSDGHDDRIAEDAVGTEWLLSHLVSPLENASPAWVETARSAARGSDFALLCALKHAGLPIDDTLRERADREVRRLLAGHGED